MTQQETRQPGWYWIMPRGFSKWVAAELIDGSDRFLSHSGRVHPDVCEIGPRIPSPDEPWQCVPQDADANMLEATGLDNSFFEAEAVWQDILDAAPTL